jgi:hypothetical protein
VIAQLQPALRNPYHQFSLVPGERSMAQPSQKQIEKFLREVMDIERRYANELKNVKSSRQEEIRELLDRQTAGEDSNAD